MLSNSCYERCLDTKPDKNTTKKENCRQISLINIDTKILNRGFPGGAVVKNLSANAGDTGSSPGQGRSHMLRSN